MKRSQRFKALMGILLLCLFLPAIFAVPYLVMTWLYNVIQLSPPPLVSQIINSMLGLFLGITLITLITQRLQPDRAGAFRPILEALETIARGNFQVRVEHSHHDNPLINELTNSINNMAVELNQMETMRQEFISNVSHELQSPLTSIRGFARVLQNDALALPERHHYLNIIEIESTRLSKLTDNLLRLACLQAEQVQTNPTSYRLDRQIRELILACEPQWTAKAIEMEVELAEVHLIADQEMLSQVWSNLIQNGIKFTPQGGTITVSSQQTGNTVRVAIRDTGIGIAEEEQAHVFERFYKADKARERSIEGSGLGLAITQKIIALHHGTIEIKSKVGVGTIFTVYLPLSPPM
jgi:two-component system phosphate regulon sensor histidine kinase PhoR